MFSENSLYSIKNLNFSFSLGKERILALRGVDLEIPRFSLITISGPSGSGKSTLLNILGLIEPMQEGSLLFQKEEISEMREKRKNQIRKFEIGFIFQQFHLFPVFSAEENVEYFLTSQGIEKGEAKKRTKEALIAVGLWEMRKKRPATLSGGQQQRVAIARAIAKKPSVIIADEPTASLDQKTGREIMEILKKLTLAKKTTVIIATHDQMVSSYADREIYLQDGQILGDQR